MGDVIDIRTRRPPLITTVPSHGEAAPWLAFMVFMGQSFQALGLTDFAARVNLRAKLRLISQSEASEENRRIAAQKALEQLK